jgi:hypothetical protein
LIDLTALSLVIETTKNPAFHFGSRVANAMDVTLPASGASFIPDDEVG